MTWLRVDDKLHSHAKTVAAGDEAMGCWLRMGSWSSDHKTDGKVPRHVAAHMDPVGAKLTRLVESGWLHETATGYELHDFLRYNPSAAEQERLTKSRAKSGSAGGSKRQANARRLLEEAGKQTSSSRARAPVPSRPVPSPDPEHTLSKELALPESPLNPDETAVLQALRQHPCLSELATPAQARQQLLTGVWAGGTVETVCQAVLALASKAGTAAAAGKPWPVDVLLERLAAFVSHSRRRTVRDQPNPDADDGRTSRHTRPITEAEHEARYGPIKALPPPPPPGVNTVEDAFQLAEDAQRYGYDEAVRRAAARVKAS